MKIDNFTREHLFNLEKLITLLLNDETKINTNTHYNRDIEKIFASFDNERTVFELSAELKEEGIVEYSNLHDQVLTYKKVNNTKAKDLLKSINTNLSKMTIQTFNRKCMHSDLHLKECIKRMKSILLDISANKLKIPEYAEEYQEIYQEATELYERMNVHNPNPFSDLSDFYDHCKNKLPSNTEVSNFINNLLMLPNESTISPIVEYVNSSRISELKLLKGKYDMQKLIRLCEELNISYRNKCYFTVPMIVRSIIDHIPPIFGHKYFKEMVNAYSPNSIKKILLTLDSNKNIADSFLHQIIRAKEVLPTEQQINFKVAVDTLLSEIIRVSKSE